MKSGEKLFPSLYLQAFEDCSQIPFAVLLTLPCQSSLLGSDYHFLQSRQTGQNNAKQSQAKLDFLTVLQATLPWTPLGGKKFAFSTIFSINVRFSIPRSSSAEEVTSNGLFLKDLAKPHT